ncbi:hypothetical protein, partial [Burkholderia multivorans]|uniref:hypothetical protein n=1 Tax=Burkholderia multivorans TaxID=87883 RepID=UPI00287011C0
SIDRATPPSKLITFAETPDHHHRNPQIAPGFRPRVTAAAQRSPFFSGYPFFTVDASLSTLFEKPHVIFRSRLHTGRPAPRTGAVVF